MVLEFWETQPILGKNRFEHKKKLVFNFGNLARIPHLHQILAMFVPAIFGQTNLNDSDLLTPILRSNPSPTIRGLSQRCRRRPSSKPTHHADTGWMGELGLQR